MEITLGGERIGSGNKNKVEIKGFERSTHNLSQNFVTTAAPGICYPCLCLPAMRADVFDIGINAAARTIPTRGPMFSTFKMQVDLYQVPMRLYQAILHNNPARIGMNMGQVKLPKINIVTKKSDDTYSNGKFADNCLMKYLGVSGIGRCVENTGVTNYQRKFNAVPILGYYDIIKNYYANKQEDNAYVITSDKQTVGKVNVTSVDNDEYTVYISTFEGLPNDMRQYKNSKCVQVPFENGQGSATTFRGSIKLKDITIIAAINDQLFNGFTAVFTVEEAVAAGIVVDTTESAGQVDIEISANAYPDNGTFFFVWTPKEGEVNEEIVIKDFPLTNIDDMRMDILSFHTFGASFVLDGNTHGSDLPFSALTAVDTEGVTENAKEMNGLCLKTYQSDLFNNWINYEWVEGEGSIAEMSKIAVSDGAIYMDALLFAKKTYDLLNRQAISGATYEDWQDVTYEESPKRHIESPMFIGGLSSEIVFEEIVQTTPTEGDPLGTLGGRGIMVKRKGGNATVHIDEASFIIGILSITPRVYQTQGNEFYMTELDSVNDLHKPNYDGLGFQNLIGERMCWTDTKVADDGRVLFRTAVGKVPAWIEYMTAVDKAYGEFTDVAKQGYMILNRNYDVNDKGEVQDFTTYVDPAKYNYVWGKSDLLSQNFWVQINFDIKARRKMSAKQIPNL